MGKGKIGERPRALPPAVRGQGLAPAAASRPKFARHPPTRPCLHRRRRAVRARGGRRSGAPARAAPDRGAASLGALRPAQGAHRCQPRCRAACWRLCRCPRPLLEWERHSASTPHRRACLRRPHSLAPRPMHARRSACRRGPPRSCARWLRRRPARACPRSWCRTRGARRWRPAAAPCSPSAPPPSPPSTRSREGSSCCERRARAAARTGRGACGCAAGPAGRPRLGACNPLHSLWLTRGWARGRT